MSKHTKTIDDSIHLPKKPKLSYKYKCPNHLCCKTFSSMKHAKQHIAMSIDCAKCLQLIASQLQHTNLLDGLVELPAASANHEVCSESSESDDSLPIIDVDSINNVLDNDSLLFQPVVNANTSDKKFPLHSPNLTPQLSFMKPNCYTF